MKKGFTLQAWGAPLPTLANAEKMFQYMDNYGFNEHLIQHTARPGWGFEHLTFWLQLCQKYGHAYHLDVPESNSLLALAPNADFIIEEYSKAIQLCRDIYPNGLRSVSCGKETDWTYKGTFNEWKAYLDQEYYYLKTRAGVPVYCVENGSSNSERREYMRSLNNGVMCTHWFAGYDHCVSGRAYDQLKAHMDKTGHTRLMLFEVGVGTNETATYYKMDAAYIRQILRFNPEYLGFWYAGGS